MKPIYLDYNATTPHDPEVIAAMRPYLEEHFGNPSSAHGYGAPARNAVARARAQVASLLGCQPDEIVFTSGGTEANNQAIKGIAWAGRSRGKHIITTQIEHPAVTEVCAFLQEEGFAVTYLPVDEEGLVSPSEVEQAITPRTILITIMHAKGRGDPAHRADLRAGQKTRNRLPYGRGPIGRQDPDRGRPPRRRPAFHWV